MTNISFIYWAIYFFLLFFALSGKSYKIKELMLPIIVLSVLVAIRYEVGHDYLQLIDYYKTTSFKSVFLEDFQPEILAFGSMALFKWIGFGVEIWFFFISMLSFIGVFFALQRFSLCNLRWSLLIYFSLLFLMNHCNIMQHGVMTGFVWLAFSYIKDNDWKHFLLFIVIGAGFHMLAWAFIPFYWILRKNIPAWLSLLIIVGAFVIHAIFLDYIYKMAAFGIFENKMNYYQTVMSENEDARTTISVGVLIYTFVLFLTYLMKIGYKDKVFTVVRNALLFSIFFQISFLGSGIFDARIGGLLNVSLIIILPYMVSNLKQGLKGVATFMLVAYTIVMFIATATTSSPFFKSGYEFIPYQTVFSYNR